MTENPVGKVTMSLIILKECRKKKKQQAGDKARGISHFVCVPQFGVLKRKSSIIMRGGGGGGGNKSGLLVAP